MTRTMTKGAKTAASAMPPDSILLIMKSPKVGGSLKPEDAICVEIGERCRGWTLKGRLRAVWCHIANEYGGDDKPVYGALKTAMGRIPGAPDYLFAGRVTVLVEVKEPIRGMQSPGQKAFEAWSAWVGVDYWVVYSADELEALLREYELLS